MADRLSLAHAIENAGIARDAAEELADYETRLGAIDTRLGRAESEIVSLHAEIASFRTRSKRASGC